MSTSCSHSYRMHDINFNLFFTIFFLIVVPVAGWKWNYKVWQHETNMICLHLLFMFRLALDVPAPFAVTDNTTELVVTAPLDREERETYSPMLICTVQTDTMIDTFFVTLHINVYDEDDNAPYVSGTDTEDVVLEFDRKQVTLLYFTTKLHISLLLYMYHWYHCCSCCVFLREVILGTWLSTTETQHPGIPNPRVRIDLSEIWWPMTHG